MKKINVNTILVYGSIKKVVGETPQYYKVPGWGRGISKSTPGLIINPNPKLVAKFNASKKINSKLTDVVYWAIHQNEDKAFSDLKEGHMGHLQSYVVDLNQLLYEMQKAVIEALAVEEEEIKAQEENEQSTQDG